MPDKEYKRPEWVRRKISESKKGIPASDYAKQRASETHKGKVTSEETKQKMREAAKHRPRNPSQPVKVTNTQTGEVFFYSSQKEAASAINGSMNSMSYILDKQHGKYKHWFIERI